MTDRKGGLASYTAAGVDTGLEDRALAKIIASVRRTWPAGDGLGSVKLDVGYFANVVDVGGIGLALTTDGVGTKVLIAQALRKYDTVGIDCVAMNVNDLLCVGATPLSMVDYIAVQQPDPEMLEEIARGLADGALEAGVSIIGGETAQLREIIVGNEAGTGFDLAGSAVGIVPLDKIIVGQDLQPGDVVIGIESSGIHSNGVTLARRALLERAGYSLHQVPPGLDVPLGEELLRPTHLYVKEVVELLSQDVSVKALIHITSDGFLNLSRVASPTGYVIENLPPVPPIFRLIQETGVPPEEMYRVFNMGIGFCVVVDPGDVKRATRALESRGKKTHQLGYATRDEARRVTLKPVGLVGKGREFAPA